MPISNAYALLGLKKQLISLLNEVFYFIGIDPVSEGGDAAITASFLDPTTVVADIRALCLFKSAGTAEEVSGMNSILLSGDRSLLAWLKAAQGKDGEERRSRSGNKLLTKAKEDVLGFLQEYVINYKESCEEYATSIWFALSELYRSETGNTMKAKIVGVMIEETGARFASAGYEAWNIQVSLNSMYRELIIAKKASSGLKARQLILLGKFLELYTIDGLNNLLDVFTYYVDILRYEIKMTLQSRSIQSKRKPDMQLVSASLQGISSVLNGIDSIGDDSEPQRALSTFRRYWEKDASEIFDLTLTAIEELSVLSARYDIVRSSMNLLLQHGHKFRQKIVQDLRRAVGVSFQLSQHQNLEVRKTGSELVEKVVEVVNASILEHEEEDGGFNPKDVVNFFLAEFSALMKRNGGDSTNGTESSGETDANNFVFVRTGALAMRGIGKLAPAIKKILGEEELCVIIDNLLINSTVAFSSVDVEENSEEIVNHLTSFMDSFGVLLYSLSNIHGDRKYLQFAEGAVALVFHVYPNLLPKSRLSISYSFLRMITYLHCIEGDVFRKFLSSFTYQAIVLTLTQATSVAELDRELVALDGNEMAYGEGYFRETDSMDLWAFLLSRDVSKARGLSILEKKFDLAVVSAEIREVFLEEIIAACMTLVGQLNIGYRVVAGEEKDADAVDGDGEKQLLAQSLNSLEMLHPINTKDYHIFLNLIGYLMRIMNISGCEEVVVSRWGAQLVREFISRCTEYPLVSSFYKILRLLITDSLLLAVSEDDISNIRHFILECCKKSTMYQDELRISVIKLLLSVPKSLIGLEDLRLPLEASLQLTGTTNVILKQALECLDNRLDQLSTAEGFIPTIVQMIFNILVHFRRPKASDDYDLPHDVAEEIARKKRVRRRKGMVIDIEEESEENQILKSSMKILGKLGGVASDVLGGYLSEGEENFASKSRLSLHGEEDFELSIPFPGGNAVINAGKLLQNLIDLAKSSHERKLRVASAEALHALTIHSIGSNIPNLLFIGRESSLFTGLLELSCNSERVTKQLFQQLVFQIIHLYSPGEHGTQLLESLFAILYSESPAEALLRNFCAKCVREHFGTTNTDKDGFEKEFKVLENLTHHIVHPNPYHRLGAAMALTKISEYITNKLDMLKEFSVIMIKACINTFIQSQRVWGVKRGISDKVSREAELETFYCLRSVSKSFVKHIGDIRLKVGEEGLSTVLELLFETFIKSKAEIGRVVCIDVWWRIVPSVMQNSTGGAHMAWIQHYRSKVLKRDAKAVDMYPIFALKSFLMPTLIDQSGAFISELTNRIGAMKDMQRVLHILKWGKQKGIIIKTPARILKIVAEIVELSLGDGKSANSEKSEGIVGMDLDKKVHSDAHDAYISQCYSVTFSSILYHSLSFLDHMISTQGNPKSEIVDFPALSRLCLTILVRLNNIPHIAVDSEVRLKLKEIAASLLHRLMDGDVFRPEEVWSDEATLKLELMMGTVKTSLETLFSGDMRDYLELPAYLHELANGLESMADLKGHANSSCWNDVIIAMMPLPVDDMIGMSVKLATNEKAAMGKERKMIGSFLIRLSSIQGFSAELLISNLAHSKGVMYTTYADTIKPLIANSPEYVAALCSESLKSPAIFSILLDIVDYSKLHQTLVGGNVVVSAILHHIESFSSIVDNGLSGISNMFMLLNAIFLSLNKFQLENISSDIMRNIVELYSRALSLLAGSQEAKKLFSKSDILDSAFKGLGHVLNIVRMYEHKEKSPCKTKLVETVQSICYDAFPLESSELQKESRGHQIYVRNITNLLDALAVSGSSELLAAILIFVREGTEHAASDILSTKVRLFIDKITSTEDEQKVLEVLWTDHVDVTLPLDIRVNAVSFFFFPFIYTRSTRSLLAVSMRIFPNLMDTLRRERDSLSLVAFAFDCVEAVYRALTPSLIRSELNTHLYSSASIGNIPPEKLKGNELTSEIIKLAHSWKSGKVLSLDTLLQSAVDGIESSFRSVCTSAYNALCAVIVSTQRKEQFFDVFLFKEDASSASTYAMWDNLVDPEEEMKLAVEVETNTLEKWKKYYSRREQKRMKTTGEEQANLRVDQSEDVRYLNSQYLADSSLSNTMPVFGTFFLTQRGEDKLAKLSMTENVATDAVLGQNGERDGSIADSDTIDGTIDELNAHPIMMSLLRCIDHMDALFEYSKRKEMPKFVDIFCENLKSLDPRKTNLRLFLSKVIVNRAELFGKWAHELLTPLAHVVISGAGGRTFHYHARDVAIVITEWMEALSAVGNVTQSHTESLSLLVQNLMELSPNESMFVARENVEVVKKLVERSKKWLTIDKSVLHRQLVSEDRNVNLVGVQLLGVLVSNGLALYNSLVDRMYVPQGDFFAALTGKLMERRSRAIANSAAEVIGMALSRGQQHSGKQDEQEEVFDVAEFTVAVRRTVEDLMGDGTAGGPGGGAKDVDRGVSVLFHVGKHHRRFLLRYKEKLLGYLPIVYGKLRDYALKCVLWSCEELNGAQEELREVFVHTRPLLKELITKDDREVQLTVLRLLNTLLPALNQRNVAEFFAFLISVFPAHRDAEVRSAFYAILAYLHDEMENFSHFDVVRTHLLCALSESNLRLQRWALHFWSGGGGGKGRLSQCFIVRSLQLLRTAYCPMSESYWVNSSALLLLSLTLDAPSILDKLLLAGDMAETTSRASGAESGADKEMDIDTSFSLVDTASLPLFWSFGRDEDKSAAEVGSREQTREELLLMPSTDASSPFSESSDLASSAESALASISSLSSRSSQGSSSLLSQYSLSSQLIGRGESLRSNRSRRRVLASRSADESISYQFPSSIDENDPLRSQVAHRPVSTGRKYLKSDASRSAVYAMRRYYRGKVRNEKLLADLRNASKKAVALTRKYKKGFLPDIGISMRDIILPLIQVVRSDFNIAKTVLVEITFSVADRIRDETITCPCEPGLFESHRMQYEEDLIKNIEDSLRKCNNTFHFVSTLHGMARSVTDEYHLVDPNIIGESAMLSSNFHSGITLLEKQILSLKHRKSRAPVAATLKRIKREGTASTNQIAGSSEMEKDHWIQLAHLYKEIGNTEIVRAIFSSHVAELRITQSALEEEISQNFSTALEMYDQALEQVDAGQLPNASELEINLWERNRLQCIHSLTMWDILAGNIEEEISEITEDSSFDEDTLSHLVSAGIHGVSEAFSVKLDRLVRLLLDSVDDGASHSFLQRLKKYSPELAFHSMLRSSFVGNAGGDEGSRPISGSLDNARVCLSIGRSYVTSLSNSAPVFATAQRIALMQMLQKMEAVEELVNVLNSDSIAISRVRRYMAEAVFPSPRVDPIDLWDFVTRTREVVLDRCEGENAGNRESMIEINLERARMFLIGAESVREKGNVYVCEVYQKRAEDALGSVGAEGNRFNDELVELRTDLLSSVLNLRIWRCKAISEQTQSLSRSQEILRESLALASDTKARKLVSQSSPAIDKVIGSVYQLLLENSEKQRKSAETKELMVQIQKFFSNAVKGGSSETQMQYVKYCDWVVGRRKKSNGKERDERVLPYIKQIVRGTMVSMAAGSSEALFYFPTVLTLLPQLAGREQRGDGQKQRNDAFDDMLRMFQKYADKVPTWMFIDWIPQLIAMIPSGVEVSGEESALNIAGRIAQPLLERLSKEYPSSLFFDFNVSIPRLKIGSQRDQKVGFGKLSSVKTGVETIWNNLTRGCPLHSKLISELDNFSETRHKVDFLLQRIKSAINQNDDSADDVVLSCAQELLDYLQYLEGVENEGAGRGREPKIRNLLTLAVQSLQNLITRAVASPARSSSAPSDVGAAIIGSDLMQQLLSSPVCAFSAPGVTPVGKFSEWLATWYSIGNGEGKIELPGQYSSKRRPLPSEHMYIVSFHQEVVVLGSLRRPKKIFIHASDERSYPFLVKSGEDVRLDERIMQLFRYMNSVLLGGTGTQSQKITNRITTYDVIPMTESLGMLKWMEGTLPLREILDKEFKAAQLSAIKKSPKGKASGARLAVKTLQGTTFYYEKWLKSVANREDVVEEAEDGDDDDPELGSRRKRGKPSRRSKEAKARAGRKEKPQGYAELYLSMYTKASREDAIANYINMQKHVPWNLLRNGIWSLVSSELHTSEAFLTFRANFTESLATFAIASYLLGIGDRHLENFLVHMASGRIIGIDFGHAFGTATQLLPVVEIVPFRLTPQLVHFLEPLDCRRSLEPIMTSVLGSLQDSKDALLALCRVFVNEPITDWQKYSKLLYSMKKGAKGDKGIGEVDPDDGKDYSVTYSLDLLDIVKLKLEGFNPAHVLAKELESATIFHQKDKKRDKERKAVIDIVKGNSTKDLRANVGERCRTCKEQVACLINLATDANVLSRMWLSWLPWC